jgi:O-antigen ligase
MFMLLITLLLLALIVACILNTTGFVRKAMAASATLLCYLGVIIFITLTFTQALKKGAKH